MYLVVRPCDVHQSNHRDLYGFRLITCVIVQGLSRMSLRRPYDPPYIHPIIRIGFREDFTGHTNDLHGNMVETMVSSGIFP